MGSKDALHSEARPTAGHSRVALGVILLAHGWQKVNEWTLDGTAAAFADMGIPAATASATFTTFVEMIGGAALILGPSPRSSSATTGTSSSSPSQPDCW